MSNAATGTLHIRHVLERAGSELGMELGDASIALLAGDGSDREFYRITRGRFTFVALSSPRQPGRRIDENDSYHRIGSHLHSVGIPVPRFIWADLENGCFLLEDLGDVHLQRYAVRGPVNLTLLYQRVLRLLTDMHQKVPAGFQASFCFDTAVYDAPFVYERELEYFRKAFLVEFAGMDVSQEDLRIDFENLAEAAGAHHPTRVIHRDFQSRNIMVCNGALSLLDFQGMRYGPPAYDLASLLVDPYVMIPRPLQDALVRLYWLAGGDRQYKSCRQFMESYRAVRLCRSMQVLGAYGYLGLVKGKTRFLRYIPRAWQQLRHWLASQCKGLYPSLSKCIHEADGLVVLHPPGQTQHLH